MSATDKTSPRASVVYWLYDETCASPEEAGYVGITGRFADRIRAHRRDARFPDSFKVQVLFEGSRDECFAFEERLRPRHSVGWNLNPGGRNGYRLGAAPSTRTRIAASKLGKPRPDLAEINRERWADPETLAGLLARNAGNTYAKGHRNALGYRHSAETKAKIGEASRGNTYALGKPSPLKGRKMSEEAREKMRARWAAMTPEARAARTEKARKNLLHQINS